MFGVVVVLALAVLFGAYQLYRVLDRHSLSAGCTVDAATAAGGSYELDTSQASVAAQMVGAVATFRPAFSGRAAARAGVLVLMAGLQESRLRNLAPGDGDRDSVGVLQQRPSQGWGGGDANKLNDVSEATREFLAALVTHRSWQTEAPADAIQAVQISADGSAYAKHEPEASALAQALQGRRAAGLSCTFDAPTMVAPATTVVSQLRHQLPVRSASTAGRAITVPGAGWQTAAWLVANADRLGVDSVAHAGRRWSRTGGWGSDSGAPTGSVVARMATVSS